MFKLVGKDVSGQPLRVYKSFKRFRSLCHQKRVEEGKMGVKIENGTEGSGA